MEIELSYFRNNFNKLNVHIIHEVLQILFFRGALARKRGIQQLSTRNSLTQCFSVWLAPFE